MNRHDFPGTDGGDCFCHPTSRCVKVNPSANNPGPTVFDCHQQLHMDYGFMTMMEYMR